MVKKGYYKISNMGYKDILSAYLLWKKFDEKMRKYSSRGVNLHEGISEVVVCYVNDFYHSVGLGSEDAKTNDEKFVQIKGSSNFDRDLTSFGPESKFDVLHFARLKRDTDEMYLYDIPIDELYDVKVNKTQTVKDKQELGQRPRFSIINRYLKEEQEKPYAIVNMLTGDIKRI